MERSKELTLSLASKTFLVGEYLALAGGPSIVLNTAPRFQLKVTPSQQLSSQLTDQLIVNGIDAQSPAGHFIKKHSEDFKNLELSFSDPHSGKGGFGASSAQFALCYALSNLPATIENVMEEYLSCAWNGEGHAPSGSDVIAQLFGENITFVDQTNDVVKTTSWPFANLKFALVRTGQKVPTHIHLNELKLREVEPFRLPVRMVWQGLIEANEDFFLQGLDKFQHHLNRKNWVAPSTMHLLEDIAKQNFSLSSKGCGALGADVLLITYRPSDEKSVLTYLNKQNLDITATSDQLSTGFQRTVDGRPEQTSTESGPTV